MIKARHSVHQLLWSLWTELGVPGAVRSHREVSVDPEVLIAYTPFLAATEPRLLGLAFDWCVANSEYISKPRLTSIGKSTPDDVRQSLATFNGALARSGVRWSPVAPPTAELVVSRTTMNLPVERLALVRLRLRALTGVAVRTEVLLELLASGSAGRLSSDFVSIGASRRTVERVLADLCAAGFLSVAGTARRRRFRLREPKALAKLVALPITAHAAFWLNWDRVFRVTYLMLRLCDQAGLSIGLRRIEAARCRGAVREHLLELGSALPPDVRERPDAFALMSDWGTAWLASVAAGEIDKLVGPELV